MAAFVGIEGAERGDSTPTPGKICQVEMGEGDGVRPEVEGGGGKNRCEASKVAFQSRVPSVEGVQGDLIVGMDVWLECLENTWCK